MKKITSSKIYTVVSIIGLLFSLSFVYIVSRAFLSLNTTDDFITDFIIFIYFLIAICCGLFLLCVSLLGIYLYSCKYTIYQDEEILEKKDMFNKRNQINLHDIKFIFKVVSFRGGPYEYLVFNKSILEKNSKFLTTLFQIVGDEKADLFIQNICFYNPDIKVVTCTEAVPISLFFVKKNIFRLRKKAIKKNLQINVNYINENNEKVEWFNPLTVCKVQVELNKNNETFIIYEAIQEKIKYNLFNKVFKKTKLYKKIEKQLNKYN